jgi:acetyl esterase/lipase
MMAENLVPPFNLTRLRVGQRRTRGMSIRTIPFSVVGESEKLAEAELLADAYLPDGGGPAPAVICIHGGGWKAGSRSTYKLIGPLLAARGYAAFSIDYRLVKGEQNLYPAAVDDVRNALRYVREHAAELNVDPDRIALMGDSAGGHLAALVGLTEKPAVAAVIGVFGVYDLAAQWEHDLPARPNDNIAALFLGKPLTEDRHLYFEASPLSHVIAKNAGPAFFLAWGTHDDIVAPAQSEAFLLALKQANFYVRTVVQDAPHFWVGEPLDEPGSYSAFFAARMLRFLDERFPRG